MRGTRLDGAGKKISWHYVILDIMAVLLGLGFLGTLLRGGKDFWTSPGTARYTPYDRIPSGRGVGDVDWRNLLGSGVQISLSGS